MLLELANDQKSSNFLQIHMLPLKSLPKILKHTTAHDIGSSKRPHLNGEPTSPLASITYNDIDNTSQVSSSSAISTLEAEEKTLRETLIMLEKQLFLVKEQVADANKRRKFDEASSLAQNLEDLNKEIDHVQGNWDSLISPVHVARSHQVCSRQVEQGTFDSSLSIVSQSRTFLK